MLGPDHPQLAHAISNLAALAAGQGRHEDARRGYAQALELGQKGLGPDHPELAEDLTGLAQALLSLGRAAEARVPAARALQIREVRPVPAALVAETRFVLARALWPLAAERSRARELAEQARAALAAGKDAEALAAVDAWLRAP